MTKVEHQISIIPHSFGFIFAPEISSAPVNVKSIDINLSLSGEFDIDVLQLTDFDFGINLSVSDNMQSDLTNDELVRLSKFLYDGENRQYLDCLFYDMREGLEKFISDFKCDHSVTEREYVLMSSKILGSHSQIQTGTEWVERNSNRLGLDRNIATYDYFFVPEYQIISLSYRKNNEFLINRMQTSNLGGYDWQCPYDPKIAGEILIEMGLVPNPKQSLYVKELNREKIKKDEQYQSIFSNNFMQKKLFFDKNYVHWDLVQKNIEDTVDISFNNHLDGE